MQVYIVTVAEAREHLPELIALVGDGNQVVISEAGKSVATLGRPPMFPTTPVEVEATRPAREATVREWMGLRDDAPVPRPEGMTMEEYLATYRVGE